MDRVADADGRAQSAGPAATEIDIGEDTAHFRTQSFTLQPGQERFLCFAATLEEDMAVAGYAVPAQEFVHHVVFVRTLAPEPDGMSECDVLFRRTWDPLFLAGAGESALDFPSDSGHALRAGTQLVAQLHLLNSGSEPVTKSAEITLKRSPLAQPRPIGAFVFGTQELQIEPGREVEVKAHCAMREPVHLVAAFPHMHLMGRALRFEVQGPTAAEPATVFERVPYDFDNQHVELLDLELAPGDSTTVRCSYENTTDEVIRFGESTRSEMCFFVGFALDSPGLRSCSR